MANRSETGARGTRPDAGAVMVTRTCGFVFTTTGRPCANLVSDQSPWCRAGHPSSPGAVSDGAPNAAPVRADARPESPPADVRARRPGSRTRRATELIRLAMASDDADQVGLRAETVLGDSSTALALLGDPNASPVARAAVVQRFGRVGALLVLGYEERGRARHLAPVNGHISAGVSERPDADAHLETLVQLFDQLGARDLYWLLCEIDEDEGFAGDLEGIDAHRWLHATYAVAARDGTPDAHRAYMCALDRVMRLVRPLVAS